MSGGSVELTRVDLFFFLNFFMFSFFFQFHHFALKLFTLELCQFFTSLSISLSREWIGQANTGQIAFLFT